MSQPGKKGGGKGGKDKNDDKDKGGGKDRTNGTNGTTGLSGGDDTADTSGGAAGDESSGASSKPQSAGSAARDAAQRLLTMCQKGEWAPVDQILKAMEKAVAQAGEDANTHPLAGVSDITTGMTPLMYAVKDNRTSLIDKMIDLGSDVGARNNDNYNVLHISAMYSREDVVKLLLTKKGVDVYSTGGKGKIPLLLAVEAGNQSMCRELLSTLTSEQLKAASANGDTALHLAVRRKDIDMVRILVDYGTSVDIRNGEGQTPLHIAAAEGDEILVKYFYGVRASASVTDNQDRTPMHLAAENGHANIIELLADKFKASIFERTKDGSTLMHIASLNGHADCAMMLFKKGDGARSIHTAARYGHVGIINTLLQKGEKVDVTTNENYTALHIAVEAGKPAVVETLLGYGADVHVRGGRLKETPLHIAARVKDGEKCALMLLKSGAGPNLATHDGNTPVHKGETPLHLASRGCRPDVVLHLINYVKEKKGDEKAASYVNELNENDESALHYVCAVGRDEVETPHSDRTVVKFLLENGANVNLLTKQHESAFHYVALAGNNDVLMEMIAHMTPTDAQKALNRQNEHGWTPLLIASRKGHIDLVNNLLANHARVDVFDNDGRSALHLASEQGYLHFLIKDHNAVIDILTLKKQTPLHLAAAAGQIEVCKLLLELGADIDATDEQGQKPIHAACQNNYSEVVKLFLQQHPSLVMATTKDGDTCAHIAAAQGSVTVIEELMKFDRAGVISDATPLQMAAEGGHAEVVKALVRAGANITDENKGGFTAVHLAAQHGHLQVLEVLRSSNTLRIISKKLGVTPLHVAAYFGQADTVRELLTHVPGTVKSDSPNGASLVPALAGVQVDAATHENGYNPMHLACYGGHGTVVGLLLSRSAELLQSVDRHGKTGLHIAAQHGHYQMVEVLLGQGAEINAPDRNGWTPLHCAARAGCFEVVRLLVESGASPKSETNLGAAPIWFAASEGHHAVLEYLMTKEHDTYALMEDRRFVYNLMVCSKNHNNKPIEEFILVSPAPVDTAAKLSNILIVLSNKEKERAKDLIAAGKFCESMATELLALAAGADSAGKILTATDRRNIEFLDVLIENEQKEVIAHTVVQRYLQELWRGALNWAAWRTLLLFVFFIICPPVWLVFTLPLGHKYYKVPIIKFMSYLTSHVYLMLFLLIVGITPPYAVVRSNLIPYWYEWILLIWLSGLLLFELTNPSDKSGLGWIKLSVLLFSIFGVGVHVLGLLFIQKNHWPTLMYCRNQLFALSFVLACVQILDFLSFHHLFGPWAIIIGNLMKDLARFLAVLAIFVFGFSMQFVALNQPFKDLEDSEVIKLNKYKVLPSDRPYFHAERESLMEAEWLDDVIPVTSHSGRLKKKSQRTDTGMTMNPLLAFELLFFAVFGQTTYDELTVKSRNPKEPFRPPWTDNLFKIVFGIYMLVSVVVLINLLIAMMSDTYQRIQAQSDIEWKFGLSKLIRSMHRTTTAPSPINLITTWLFYLVEICRKRVKTRKRQSLVHLMGSFQKSSQLSPRSKAAGKWLSKVKKGHQIAPKESSVALSVAHISPLGSQLSFTSQTTRIEHVTDWEAIAKKYRALMGQVDETKEQSSDANDEEEEETVVPVNQPVQNISFG
nr:unnamed protein product [Callosobruchus analis]